jgi:hypothetical protein
MITKTFTRKYGGKVFVITGICGLAGTEPWWVGLRGTEEEPESGPRGCRGRLTRA